jgi:aspartate/methionine/tyrosine aminotransferase
LPGLLWEFNIQDLSNLIRPETSLIIINFPHNPTGASISDQDLLQIVGFCRQLDIPLFSDEMYRMLESDKAERLPFVSDIYEKGIGLFGMSKTFSLPGLRTGWLASENIDFLEKARAFKDYTTICSSGPSEILALIGLRARDKIIKTNLDLIKKNLDILDDFFSEYDNLFEWARPGAGPVGLVGFRPENSGFVNADHFCSDLISKAGVLLAPAGCFDYEENAFRIGFARKNMPDCLRQLEIFLKTNKKHLKTN